MECNFIELKLLHSSICKSDGGFALLLHCGLFMWQKQKTPYRFSFSGEFFTFDFCKNTIIYLNWVGYKSRSRRIRIVANVESTKGSSDSDRDTEAAKVFLIYLRHFMGGLKAHSLHLPGLA